MAAPEPVDPYEALRQVQARAEASEVAIGHQLAEAIHTALNALQAVSTIAKTANPAPAPKRRGKAS